MRRLSLIIVIAAVFAALAAVPATASAATEYEACLAQQAQGYRIACRAFAPDAGDASYQACLEKQRRGMFINCGRRANAPTVASLSYQGWAYLNLNYCPPGNLCAALHRSTTPAWSWTGTAWAQSALTEGWVYVWPYTGSWQWAWTPATGWVAVSGARFELRAY